MGAKIDLTGLKFNRLTVIEEAPKRKGSTSLLWKCRCECGNYAFVSTSDLKRGHTKSCGCFQSELVSIKNKNNATHGHTINGKKSHEYHIWLGIKSRCCNPNHIYYDLYGGRGIVMFDEWIHDFDSFFSYIGTAPSTKLTIERIDNDGNYEPGNLRWATRKEQANNRSNTHFFYYNGERVSISYLSEIANISHATMKNRLLCGWDVIEALTKPVIHHKK